MKIIGFNGKAGVGKDTAANELKLAYEAKGYAVLVTSFAAPLRAGLSAMLGVSYEQMFDPINKNVPIQPYNKSPRLMLQTLGTEWGRNMIHSEIWLLRAKSLWDEFISLNSNTHKECVIIISDVRFDNEAEFVLEAGGRVVEIIRNDNPYTQGVQNGGAASHSSEQGLSSKLTSYSITNMFATEDLFRARIKNDVYLNSYVFNL